MWHLTFELSGGRQGRPLEQMVRLLLPNYYCSQAVIYGAELLIQNDTWWQVKVRCHKPKVERMPHEAKVSGWIRAPTIFSCKFISASQEKVYYRI